MNEVEVQVAVERYRHHPVLGPASQSLANLVEWTNSHSDGWPYWPKPARAARALMALIEGAPGARLDRERAEVTAAQYRAALRPVKAFRTRHGAQFTLVEI